MSHSSKELSNKYLGREGENLVCKYLKKRGYRILKRNYVTPFGEADIIAFKQGTYCLVEVKTRTGNVLALPEEAVNYAKQERYRTIARYLCGLKREELSIRYDVASVLNGEIQYFEGAYI